MKIKLQVASRRSPVLQQNRAMRETCNFQPATCNDRPAFSLIEVLVVVSLLSLIVLALMAVFTSTQRAFRASITQVDVLEGGRATMELMASDLRALTPSYQNYNNGNGALNFLVTNNASFSQPLIQSLPGGSVSRANLLQQVFILNHQNTGWWGVGYAVTLNSSGNLYSLYRLQYPLPPGTSDPSTIFTSQVFQNFFLNPTNGGSHLLDGVVHFVVRAYGPDGTWIPFGYVGQTNTTILNQTASFALLGGEGGVAMYSNNVPAAVEVELGVVEDRTLQRAESFPTTALQTNYLSDKSGNVHVFRQRVSIPNVDPTAYQ